MVGAEWDIIGERPAPSVSELLGPQEVVINPHYMLQLLKYGMKIGETHQGNMGPEALQREAEVCAFGFLFLQCNL